MTCTRPILRYHGGKWRIAPWIVEQFPAHRCYVEPFGGGGSVLLRKPRSRSEIYNDLDEEVVNLFRVARDRGDELARRLELTPYARAEFDLSYLPAAAGDDVERARRLVVRSFMGFGTNCRRLNLDGSVQRSGFRAQHGGREDTLPSKEWASYPAALAALVDRLRGVVIENAPAVEIMRRFDGPGTLHYVDPPYVHSTRVERLAGGRANGYAFEMSDADHRELAAGLSQLRGAVVVSGYRSELYDELFAGWRCITTSARAMGNKPTSEALWLRNVDQGLLF